MHKQSHQSLNRLFSVVPFTTALSVAFHSSLPVPRVPLPFSSSQRNFHPPTTTVSPVMSGNYGYPPNYTNYSRPPDPSRSRQPPAAPQAPQYAHGHQTYTPHAYQNVPPTHYMTPYPPYPVQPYPPQQPSYPSERRVEYSSYSQGPAPPQSQPPRPAPAPSDQYPPTTAAPSIYNPWPERTAAQAPRTFNEDEEKTAAVNAFKRFDQDAGGYLDLQEFMDALRALHLAISYHEALDCFVRCDVNEDGRITQDEFVRIYVDEKRKRPYSMQYHQHPSNPPPPPPPPMA